MKNEFAVLILGLALAGCSCTDSARPSASTQDGRAELAGTVLDRATGVPVQGARVTVSDGRQAKSDSAGRFLLVDLAPGLAGEVKARAEDGREGIITIRPLTPGRLEVVLYVGR
jgi:hypothetical protein